MASMTSETRAKVGVKMLNFIYKFFESIGYYHPIHPTEVHMPIGLVVGGLIFSIVALILHRSALAQAARYCFILAFLFMFPTVIFGIMDWQHYYYGAWLHPIKIKLVLSGILLVLLGWVVFINRRGVEHSVLTVTMYAFSFLIVVALGYYGGELVLGGRSTSIPPSLGQASSIFEANCAMCHSGGRAVSNPQLSLRNTPQLANFETFIDQIRNPKPSKGSSGNMPPISKETLSDEEAWQLYQYIVHVAGAPPG
jgi:uncharacterized membrane protein